MKEPTIEEVLRLVEFERDADGVLCVKNVNGDVWGDIEGEVMGNVVGSVGGNVNRHVYGNVMGHVYGSVGGNVNFRKWKYADTPKEKMIRLIRQGKCHEEAIEILGESE